MLTLTTNTTDGQDAPTFLRDLDSDYHLDPTDYTPEGPARISPSSTAPGTTIKPPTKHHDKCIDNALDAIENPALKNVLNKTYTPLDLDPKTTSLIDLTATIRENLKRLGMGSAKCKPGTVEFLASPIPRAMGMVLKQAERLADQRSVWGDVAAVRERGDVVALADVIAPL